MFTAGKALHPRARTQLPARFGQDAEGAELAELLEPVHRENLDGHSQVLLLKARARLLAQVQAAFNADMVAVAESVAASHDYDSPEDRWAYCADEIRAALTWTRRAAEHNLSWAYDLIENHPEVGEAL
ncbi:MAG TPA: hypothetical protein VID03_04955, partial [Acidimicrobiia bacterium]